MDRSVAETEDGEVGASSRPWAADFTYAYLRRMLSFARDRFSVRPVGEAPPPGTTTDPVLLLRHDIDVSLAAAVAVAEIEAELGLRATYMVMTTNPLYEAESDASRACLRRLVDNGHEIGLHFDSHNLGEDDPSPEALETQAVAARDHLAAAAGAPVRSISFHRPPPAMLQGPRMIAGCVNAYAADLMDSYISDSKGSWRTGEPMALLEQSRSPILQLLVHPIWWGESHSSAQDRLEEFFTTASSGLSPERRDELDQALRAMVPAVRRRGFGPREGAT
jgi:hypothetical protein